MIKRIKLIANVGTFHSLNLAKETLDKFVVFFGRNGSGKSTISDIFRSLAEDNKQIITNRKTIAIMNRKLEQKIDLSFIEPNSGKEVQTIFNTSWTSSIKDYKIYVFDSQFVHENVFTGIEIQRDNKKNLTNLFLGVENVKLAKTIEEHKSFNNIKTKEIDRLKRNLLAKSSQFNDAFIKSPYPNNFLEIEQNIKIINDKIDKLIKIKSRIDAIKTLSIINDTPPNDLIDLLQFEKEIKYFLELSYDEVNFKTLEDLQNHIKDNFSFKDGKEDEWILKGIKYSDLLGNQIKKSSCPFCSQPLTNSIKIIDTYQKLYKKNYLEFLEIITDYSIKIKEEISDCKIRISKLIEYYKDNSIKILKFSDYINDEQKKFKDDFDQVSSEILH